MEAAFLEAIIRCALNGITVVDEYGKGILINPALTQPHYQSRKLLP